MRQRWALVVMGMWLMGSVFMSVVATQNFYTVDRLLAGSPSAAFGAMVQKLGQPAARDLLRYLSSELNRLYFQMWNVAQLAFGVVAFWLLRGPWFGAYRRPAPIAGVAVMFAIVVLMAAYLTPAIVSLGRNLDFIPREPSPPGMERFWILHAAYTSLEMIKLLVGGIVAAGIARMASETPRS